MKKQDIKKLQRMIALTLSLVGGLYSIAWAAPAATALPTGDQDMKNATVTRDTTNPVMTIEQTKGQNRAFISWDTFNIGKDATVNVKQYSGADLLVNAVRGNNMSEIAGKLNATGNVALINPNGVIFMDGAQVNVGGLGVYAAGYDAASSKIINSGKEGSIEIQSGAVINVGVSAALANLSALNIAPSDYAIAIDSSGEDGYTNRIHLVAEGNVEIEGGSTIKARDYTYVGDSASVGAEGFNVGVGAVGMGGKIYIRSDRDADDYGSVIITHGENSSKPVMQSVNGVSIYTNAAQVDGDDDTTNGINAAVSRTESGDGATTTYYTKHDYKNGPSYEIDGSSYTDGTSVSVEGPGVTADKLSSSSADNKITTSYGGNGATTITTSLLVNNIDQLQDIEDGTHGNLDGRYVLGRDINATDDVHSYIDDGILYKLTDGKLTKWSTKDGVAITGTKSGGDLSKTVNGTTIGYSKDENKATTTLTGGTILSNSNGTVGAENTQWSTTKGVSTVTDKTAGSTYTIQSDKKSVVDQDGLTSNTAAKTVTDKDNTYTADIGGHTVTHTSDNSVTNTNSKTVTKAAGTSDAGYTATVTDGSATAAGTSGTIAINDITYQVTGGKVGDTVTYGGSSVNTGKNTVTAGGVTTAVTENGTGTDGVKAGTIASDRVTVNGTTTTVTDGTTSYQITTGTDAVTYTKGTTNASIAGTVVTTGKVWADTSAGKVVKGDMTAVITSDTSGRVTYSGQEYTVSDDTVSMTDSQTGKTVTVEGEDAAKVLNIFSAAKTDLSNAQAIYGDYTTDAAKAQSLTKTLDGAIETLKEVTEKSTAEETVRSNFDKAAAQLKSDTALFGAASTALSNADTALTQYNALQKEISDNTKLEPALKQAYDEFQSSRLDDTTINNIHSDKWDGDKGFNPIGSSDAPFTGKLDGFSGETVFGLYNLTINRSDEDNVGLISVAGASGHAAALSDIHLYSTAITGNKNVGTVAGTLQQGSSLSWSGTAGTVKGTESLGGLVGLVDGSSIWDSSSSATVEGGNKAGGIAGTLQNGGTLTDVRNFGNVSGKEDVGGIAGYVEGGTITGSGSAIYNYANTYNTGTVTGTTNTGGIVGHAKGIYMYGVFNTNEDTPLSKKSQLIVGDDNTVIKRGDGTTDDKGKTITDTALQSNYGKVTGVTNTGGLVGWLDDAPDFKKTVTNINISSTTATNADGKTTKEAVKDAPITNNVIDTSYNAGNITGTGDNTGGLVGSMTGGTLSNVYNADNNTVLREQGTIPDAVRNASITDTSDHSKIYAYNSTAKVSDSNQDLTQYYSFFTVDDSGSRTYYYFLPVKTTSGTTQKGAGGIYVTADGKAAESLPSTKERYYFNRTFNKDANVTGTGKNTGGLVGSMMTTSGTTAVKYSAGSVIDSAYNAGTITGSDTAATGALVGSKDADSLINDSFYVTGKDVTNGKVYSNVDQAVGKSSTDTSKITNTAALDAVESKKKYYVSHDSTRTNFPGVQQKTDTDKDSSTIYYEYTSGTNGSFYTDGTGSIDSIKEIYPIKTEETKNSATGKTTYTSSRSKTAAYTKVDGTSTFTDTNGNTYTATYDTATRQIVLTPVSGSSSTAATVVLNAVLAARTANETWTIYEDQTRPLLTAFLNKASLSRSFSYDGTTHNLKTDDVANLYGRADFDGDAGKDVQLSNYQLSSNGVSSEYTYDNTSIWSPQHGYFMDPESTLVINPVNMSANLYGTRVYGDIFNTRGYYVCVPYTATDGTKHYSFYQPTDESSKGDKEGYTLLKDTDSDKALTKFFGKHEQTEDGLLKLAEEKGFYVLELNGFINGEGVNNLGNLITGLVTTLSNSSSTTTTSGSNLQHLFSSVTADTYLDAGIYNVTNAQITGLTATNQNYTINYGGQLTVKQAELYYTYDGSREYGAQNKDGEHTYTLVGVDSKTADSSGKYTSTHGFLKYWDLDSQTITIKNDDGTETTIDNPYKNFFKKKKNGNSYEINQDNIGVTGYTAEKTTTTTDVTTGTSTTVTSKDDTKSASLDDIYANMTGTVNTDSINKPGKDSTTTSKVIGSYGDGAVNDNMYTHVLVDKDGKPIGYKVTSFASTNKDAGGTIQLYFKTSSDTTDAADKNIQAAVNKFNQNYKLVWKEGGTYDKEYTIGNPEQSTDAKDAGIQVGKAADGKGLTVNDSTFTITPKTATVTITGHRAYGDTMDTSAYTTSTGAAASGQDTEDSQYNLNIDGLTNGDGASVLDTTKTETLLSGIDNTSGTAADAKSGTEINKYTNVLRDGTTKEAVYQNINDFEKSKVSVVNDEVKNGTATDQMKVTSTTTGEGTSATISYDNPDSILTSNNYDYILQDGIHQLKITPVDIHVTVSGGKTYGDFTSQAATDYTASVSSVSGGVTYDGQKTGQVKLKTGEVADIVIANHLDEKSNAGTYTYDSSKSTDGSTAFTISLTDDTANTDQNDYHADNYNISFDTVYTISPAELWYTYEGTRAYGADNTTTKNTFKLVGVDGTDSNERVRGFLKSWDADKYGVGSDKVISLTTVGDDKNALYTMTGMADAAANKKDDTIRNITGGNSDNTYSHVIVDSNGKVIGYNLSSLGLASDDKLNLKDATQEQKDTFKKNYELVWKPQATGNAGETGTLATTQSAEISKHTVDGQGTTVDTKDITVGASTLTINPVVLTVEVTGKRQYGHTMTDSYQTSIGKARVTTNGVNVSRDKDNPDTFLENGTYNLNLNGLVANDDASVLNTERVKEKLKEVEGDGKDTTKINKYTAVKQGTTDNLATKLIYHKDTVHAFDITKRDDNTENKNSQITVMDTTNGHYNLLNDGNYDYRLVDGTHTLTIDRYDLNLNITAERKYGDISNQQVVSDYLSTAKKSGAEGAEPSYKTGITSDANGLQNGETIDFTKSTVALSDNFAQADAGTYQHDWYNDDTNTGYTNGTAGITNITLTAGTGSAFDPKNYNIHYTTTYTIDKADLYYTYDGERHYGEDNASAAHTYTIVGKDNDSSKESVRGYLKSWDSGVLSGGNVLNNDLLTVTNVAGNGDNKAYTMTGVAVQEAETTSADKATNVTAPGTSQSIGKDSGYSHVIVDKDGKILSYTLDTFGTELAGKDAVGTLAKNYNLIWKQGGSSHQLDKVYTADKTASTIDGNGALQAAKDTTNKITVKNSSFKIDPLALTVTVTGQRDYGDTMTTNYKTDGTAGKDAYNIALTGSFANGETAGSVLNEDNVKKMLASLENDAKGDGAATRENSNGKDGKISRYTDVKRKEDNKSQIDSYSLNVGSTDTSSTITLASDVQKDANGKVTSIKHADSKEHGFNVLNDGNYDYVVSEGSHRLTINPVDLTVNVKGESTYGKADTTYTVTSTEAKNRETLVAGSETKSNLAANSPAGSYTADGWTDTTGAATSTAAASGKYLNTAALRAGQSSDNGTATEKGIYQVQLAAGTNTDGSGLSTFSANNYNITYHTTQVIHPEKLTIAIDGTKVYGSQPTGLTAGNMTITSGELASDDSLNGLTVADNMGQLTDAGTYRHNWSIYAGGSVPAESYTYTDADGQTHTGDSTAKSWITGVGVSADNKAFDFNNYDVDFQSTYEVTKRPLQLDVTSTSVYGDPKDGYIYTAAALTPAAGVEEGLVSGQQFNPTDISVTDDIKETTDAGTYTHRADGTSYSDAGNQPKETTYKGITAVAADSLKDAGDTGFKSSNYEITLHQGTHVVEKRTVRATVSGSQVYGESAPTSGEAYQVAFDMAGGTDVNAHEGLVGGQSIANSQVTVQNSVGETNDVGTYTTTQSDVGAPIAYGNNPERVEGKDQGIDGLVVSDGTGTNAFKNNNYNIVLEKGSYTVNQRPVTFLTTGSRTYGEENDKVGDYTIKQLNTADGEGLTGRNAGIVTEDKAAVINKTDALTDAGSYGTESDSAQVLDIDDSVQEILGDDYKNYTITYQDQFTINPRTVRVTIEGESTYGDAALTAGRDYKTIDFEQAGADGVAAQKGLVSGQTIDKSQVTVQTDGLGEKTDAGTYHLSTGDGQPGISGITVKDDNGFKNNNYRIVMDDDSTYTIDKRPLTITIRGEKTYGNPTSFSGRDYTVSQSGLQNQETIDFDDARVLHSQETADPFSEAGQYSSRDGKGILGFEDSTLQGEGFKLGNYALTYDTDFVIHKRPVDVYMESRRTSGSPSSLRMDEPMTMRNVPKEHQSRFLSDMEVIDTSPQVIAAGDYPSFDGRGYLDLYFAGDIYRNYDIHRHTVYHILPDRMVKLSIYNAVQPVRRPILDVMYFKVNGSEGINRWGGTENLPYGGEIILNKDVTSSISAKPNIIGKSDFPQVPGQEFLKEEITQAVPVVYTDGRKQDVRGRYYLAYENDNVAMYPAEDAVSAPLPKEASVSRENRRTLLIPWQGGEGEYHVAYADGIVQIYPENETAYRLVQAKGKDEQLLLERSLTSAVRELGVQLEGIDAIYIYTK